MIEKTRRF